MEQTLCIECQQPIFGRSDKKFCSDACRIHYHNQRRREQFRSIHQVIRVLIRNRNILQHLWIHGKTSCRKEELLEKGFCFDYITSCRIKRWKTSYCCFDWSYHIRMGHVFITPSPK